MSNDLEVGDVVGDYRIEMKLAEGGYGTIYAAVHPLIAKKAAIKVLHRSLCWKADAVTRFVTEARAVNEIQHRNIVDVFGFGRLPDGRHYYMMELLSGQTLDHFLEESGGRLTLETTIEILKPVARALDAAHARGIAHRDLKPDNIIVGIDDEGKLFPKVFDFGIAKLLVEKDRDANPNLTRKGVAFGTPLYMSPEQARGKNIDHRTDIYSLGVITFQLLTGRTPFVGAAPMDVLVQHVQDPSPPPSRFRPELPRDVDAAVLAMLAKNPEDRPPTLSAAVAALEGEVRPRAGGRRAPLPWAAAVVALAAGGVALGLSLREPPPPEPPREVAYEMTASAADAAEPATATADAAGEPAAPDAAPTAASVEKKHVPPPPTRPRTPRDFTRLFAAREAEVAACIRKHTIEGSQLPPMSVHFHVGQDGKVISARVEPESVAATPLGGCLAGAARSARFGQLDKELHFAIPLRVK